MANRKASDKNSDKIVKVKSHLNLKSNYMTNLNSGRRKREIYGIIYPTM
jgi:hypothetical protein